MNNDAINQKKQLHKQIDKHILDLTNKIKDHVNINNGNMIKQVDEFGEGKKFIKDNDDMETGKPEIQMLLNTMQVRVS